ncbi:hypothetical protein [Deinococcus planocerae]|uniref:hypothetical protein n=1 Tax=Deinococcus planocerae TaxID=1737569 RepID=UPI0011AF08BC|nr:hypothetical protein [Deinococcus planocerae]
MTKSKFSGLADLHRDRTNEEPEAEALVSATPPPAPVSARQGRARGKSSSGEYQKTTILLHSDVYHAVQTKLLSTNRGKAVADKKDMSDVVNDLLRAWSKKADV